MSKRFDLKKNFDQLRSTIDPDAIIMILNDFKKYLTQNNVNTFDANEQMMITKDIANNFFTDMSEEIKDVALQAFVEFAPSLTSTKAVDELVTQIMKVMQTNSASEKTITAQSFAVEVIRQTIPILFINQEFAKIFTNKFAHPIFDLLEKKQSKENQIGFYLETADVLIRHNGKMFDYNKLIAIFLPYLHQGSGVNKRRAVQCVSHMTKFCTAEQIDKIMTNVLEELQKCTSNEQLKVLISIIPLIATEIKTKYVKYVARSYELLKEKFDVESEEDSEDDEIKESILNALNVIVLSTSGDVGEILIPLVDLATEYLTYDPNVLVYSDDEEGMEEEEFEEDEIEYEDEDDVSWKLRKLSGEIIHSIILKRVDVIDYVLEKSLKNIVKKLTEKVDIVLNVVVTIYYTILKIINDGNQAKKEYVDETYEKVFGQLKEILSSKKIGEKPKISSLMIIKEMAVFNTELFAKHIGEVSAIFVEMFKEIQSNIEIMFGLCDTLKVIFKQMPSEELDVVISPILIERFDDKNFRIAIEAIKTEGVLVENATSEEEARKLNISLIVKKLVDIVKSDKDHEVKDESVNCIGVVLKKYLFVLNEGEIKEIVNEMFKLFENTFLKSAGLQVIQGIVSSRLFDIIGNVDNILIKTIDQTKQATRQVKLSALTVAKVIMECRGDVKEQTIKTILPTVSAYIYDNDSYIVDIAVSILICCAKRQAIGKSMVNDCYKTLVNITKGNNAREIFAQRFMEFTEVMAQIAKNDVVEMITDIKNHLYTKANLYLTGAMYSVTNPDVNKINEFICKMKTQYKSKVEQSAEYYKTIVYIYTIGFMALKGKVEKDLVYQTFIEYLKIENDAIRQATSFALGSIPNVIPSLFEQLKKEKTHSLMNAMKEAVKYIKKEEVENVMNQLLTIPPEEKYIVPLSETFGRLIAYDANIYVKKYYLPTLEEKEGNAALIGSIKGCMSACDPKLFIPLIPKIVKKLDLKLPEVKGALFSITTYLLLNAKKDIAPYVSIIIQHLLPQTVVDEKYVKKASFCKIEHIIDSGLDARKAVFDCLSALIEGYLGELNYITIVDTLFNSIEKENDHDLKLLCFNLLTRMAVINSNIMVENIENYTDRLRSYIKDSLDDKSKDAETPKQQEISKAVCRFVGRVSTHKYAVVANKFGMLMNDIANSAKLGALYKSLIPKGEGH